MFAALDLGTNNCRLHIVSPLKRGYKIVDSFNRVVCLGEGLHHTGLLSEAAMKRTMYALQHCADRIKRRKTFNIYAVATEACRRAANAPLFLDQVKNKTGLSINIISTREEAELALEGCAPFLHDKTLMDDKNRALLFDIGGGSTEIIWVRIDRARGQQTLAGYCSIPVGVLTLKEQFKKITTDSYNQMVLCIIDKLLAFEQVHRIRAEILRNQVQLMGVSGTITTLASLILKLEKYNRSAVDGMLLKSSETRKIIKNLLIHKINSLESCSCIDKDRIEYIIPGCAIFEAIHTLWPIGSVIVADRGLRDGIIAKMMRYKYHKNKSEFPTPYYPLIQNTSIYKSSFVPQTIS